MPKVQVLPEHIASQIAAGEVIERPASVVKELVENSLDAGATQIEIAISSDCRDIRVADNGCGMDAEDGVLAFHRHATSKLASADDLWSIRTMGFRGEAIPSVASIARLTCLTRTADSPVGTKIESADGIVSANETGCAPGTVMEVIDLFYNVPARLKFLKKPSTEFAHIHEIVQALAISFPKVVFQLLNNGEVILKTSGSGKLAQALVEAGLMSGKEELCTVTYAELKYGMAIYGYAARPTHFRSDRKGIVCIVNNRPVRCPLTFKALDTAYADLIPKGKSPMAVLTITIDPKQVDINVHPTKKEIKYSNANDVYVAIQRAVAEAIRASTEIQYESAAGLTSTAGIQSTYQQEYASLVSVKTPASAIETHLVAEATLSRPVSARKTTEQLHFGDRLSYTPVSSRQQQCISGNFPAVRTRAPVQLPAGWRLVGYLQNTYFLVETPEGLSIVEQHIAHERTIYERLRNAQEIPGRTSEYAQKLVISVPLNLSPQQKDALHNNLDLFNKLGFDFEFQDPGNVICTQVPLELAHKDYGSAVQSIIEELCLTNCAELELEATKSIACQAAVKNGMTLSEGDIIQLISDWLSTPRNDTCPHGRPIKIDMTMERLFQMFHPA